MALQLYNIWLQEAATSTADDEIRAAIQQAGLLGQGGTASERIAAESIDLVVRGQWRLGDVLSRRHATEGKSLGASGFEAIPLFDDDRTLDKRGYYHVQRVQTNPAHQTTEADYEYTVALAEAGTRHTHWRATRTNVETVSTGLATGAGGLLAIDGQASKVRWFDSADGKEAATVQDSVGGNHGAFDLYDPAEPSFDDPLLIYEVPFTRERFSDVAVYDDVNASRTITFATDTASVAQYDNAQYDSGRGGGTIASATRWNHVYHTGYEFDGRPVVDTRRLRVTFDEKAGVIEAEQHDGFGWSPVTIDHSNYDLFDADVISIGPADVRVYSEWEKTDGTIDDAVLSFQRGADEVVVRIPDDAGSIDGDLESLLAPIASTQNDDPSPAGGLIRRTDVSGQVV